MTFCNGASTITLRRSSVTDGQTPVVDIELIKALAKVMGLSEGTTTHAEFLIILSLEPSSTLACLRSRSLTSASSRSYGLLRRG